MRHVASLACLLALITGCSDTDSSGVTETTIAGYAVTGTDGMVGGPSGQVEQTVVNANQNGGQFAVTWNVEAVTTTTRVRLFISRDNILDEGDALMLDVACGGTNPLCPETGQNSVDCTFDTDVTLTCGTGASAQITDLSTYFSAAPGLPGDYLLALQACDTLLQDCLEIGANVQFE